MIRKPGLKLFLLATEKSTCLNASVSFDPGPIAGCGDADFGNRFAVSGRRTFCDRPQHPGNSETESLNREATGHRTRTVNVSRNTRRNKISLAGFAILLRNLSKLIVALKRLGNTCHRVSLGASNRRNSEQRDRGHPNGTHPTQINWNLLTITHVLETPKQFLTYYKLPRNYKLSSS